MSEVNRKDFKNNRGNDSRHKKPASQGSGRENNRDFDKKPRRDKFEDPLIPRDTFAFFYRVNTSLSDRDIDNVAKLEMVAEAFDMCIGNVQHFACNVAIGPILETILTLGSPQQLRKFTLEFLRRFKKIACHKVGSHVAETTITTLSTCLHADEDNKILDGIIRIMERDILEDLQTYCSSHYSNEVFTALVKFCHGNLEEKTRKHSPLRRFIRSQSERLNSKAIAEPMAKLKEASEKFLEALLKEFDVMLPDYEDQENEDFCGFDKWVQSTLRLSAACKRDDLLYLIDHYGKSFFDVDQINGPVKTFTDLEKHHIAVHTMSAIFESASDEFVAPFITFHIIAPFTKFIENIAECPTPTVRLYATLASRADGAQTDKLISKFEQAHFEKFLSVNAHWYLISVLGLLDNCDPDIAEDFTKKLLLAYKIEESDSEIVKRFATIEGTNTISSFGLKILWNMIKHLAHPYNGIILASVRKCSQEQLLSLACSPGGSHFLEDLIALKDTKFNKTIFETLRDKMCFMAAHVQASYVVQSFFNNYDKLLVMDEICSKANVTSKTPAGKHIWFLFDGAWYMKNKPEWCRRFNVRMPEDDKNSTRRGQNNKTSFRR